MQNKTLLNRFFVRFHVIVSDSHRSRFKLRSSVLEMSTIYFGNKYVQMKTLFTIATRENEKGAAHEPIAALANKSKK
jgi:hypothetical protein